MEAEKEPSGEGDEPAVDDEVTIATDEAVPAEDNVSDTPSVEVITQDDLDLTRSDVEGDDFDLKVPEEAHDSESASTVEVITQDDLEHAKSDMAAADDLEAGAEAEADTVALHDGMEPASETVTEMIAVPVMTELPPSGALNLRRRHLSNSDSSGRKQFSVPVFYGHLPLAFSKKNNTKGEQCPMHNKIKKRRVHSGTAQNVPQRSLLTKTIVERS